MENYFPPQSRKKTVSKAKHKKKLEKLKPDPSSSYEETPIQDIHPSTIGWNWHRENSLIYGSNSDPTCWTTKIALFDMDGCLIKTKSKKKIQ